MCAKQRVSLHSQRNGSGWSGANSSSRAFAATLSFALRKTSSAYTRSKPPKLACQSRGPSRLVDIEAAPPPVLRDLMRG
jgi:hypothetical protein